MLNTNINVQCVFSSSGVAQEHWHSIHTAYACVHARPCLCHALCARIIKTLWFTCGKRAEGWGRSDLWDAAREDRGGEWLTQRERGFSETTARGAGNKRKGAHKNKRCYGKEFGAWHSGLCAGRRRRDSAEEKVQIPRTSAWEWEAGSWLTEESSTVCLVMAGNSFKHRTHVKTQRTGRPFSLQRAAVPTSSPPRRLQEFANVAECQFG